MGPRLYLEASESSSTDAAVQVLTSPELFRFTCTFLAGQPTWLAELERTQSLLVGKELQLTLQLRSATGAIGLMPFLAIQQRDLRVLQRLWILHKQPAIHKNPRFWFTGALHDAATSGNLEALEWLHTTTGEMCAPSTLSRAAMHGYTDVVEWLLARLPGLETEAAQRAMVKAAVTGHLGILKAFHAWRAGLCTSHMMDLAAANGHLDIVEFLHEQGSEGCTSDAVDHAAKNGHEAVVKWLLANRTEGFTEAAMRGAVEEGRLAVVQLFWEEYRVREGTHGDKTAVLIDGVRKGVPNAIHKNDLAMLSYVLENMGDHVFPPHTLALTATVSRDLAVFRFLQQSCRPQNDGSEAPTCDPEIAQFLLHNDTFSSGALTKILEYAKYVKDPNVSMENVVAVQIALHERQGGTDANVFAHPIAKTETTSRAQRRTTTTRRVGTRPSPRPRPQAFLVSSAT
jgi:hypothetical protein